jgi:RNA polymerase sigma-70 factor (ECF subfamily)
MNSYNALTDLELKSLLNTGDEAAFAAIYSRYWKRIFAIASKRLGDEADAEEVVQDIFCNLWRKREKFELSTGFENYFAIAVKFEVLDVMRKRAHANSYEKELRFTYSEHDDSTLRQLDLLELQNRLMLAVKELPEKCQLVFRLKHEQGFSQKQIAETLDISEKTVEAHLARAKKTLRSDFGDVLSAMLFIFF